MKASVRILLFATLRELIQSHEILIEIEQGMSAKDLIHCLKEAYPQLAGHICQIRIAVNQEMAQTDSALSDGDEVALLMPISGGWYQ